MGMYTQHVDVNSDDTLLAINHMDQTAEYFIDTIIQEGNSRDPFTPSCECGVIIDTESEGSKCPKCDTVVEPPSFKAKYCIEQEGYPFINLDELARVLPDKGNNTKVLIEVFCGTRKRTIGARNAALVKELEQQEGIKLLRDGNIIPPGVATYEIFLMLYELMIRRYYGLSDADPLPDNIYVNRYVIPTAVTITSMGGKAKIDTVSDLIRILKIAPKNKLTARNKSRWTGSIVEAFFSLYEKIEADVLAKKKGFFVQTIFSLRVPGAFRATLLNLHGVHAYDDVDVPFDQTLITCEPQIIEFLRRKNVPLRKIHEEIRAKVPTPNLISAMKELERIRPNVTIFRNPSQGYYAFFTLKLRRVNYHNYKDTGIYVSPMVYVYANADIDGDQVNAKIQLTEKLNEITDESNPALVTIANGANPNEQFNKAGIPKHTGLRLLGCVLEERDNTVKIDDVYSKIDKYKGLWSRDYRKSLDTFETLQFGKTGRDNLVAFHGVDDEVYKLMKEAAAVERPYSLEARNKQLREKFYKEGR